MSPTVYDLLRGALFWIMFYFVSKFIREWWYNTIKPKPNHMSKKKKISGEKDKGNDSNALMKMIEKQQDGGIDIKATGNKTEHYSWIQTSEDVEVKIPLEPLFDEVSFCWGIGYSIFIRSSKVVTTKVLDYDTTIL